MKPARNSPTLPAPELSLVICTLNEGEAIGPLLAEVAAALSGVTHEIIVVDDESSDGTAARVRSVAAGDPRVRLIERRGVRGLASAAVEGWDAADGRVLGLMDGDGQHDPALIPALLRAVHETGAELAVASRYVEQGPTGLQGRRDWLSRAGTRFSSSLLRSRLTDPLSGCFLMRRAWYDAARPRLSSVGFKILLDLVASSRVPPRLAERPTALRARRGGASKFDLRTIADLAALVVEKWTGGVIRARLVLFAAVGVSGVVVNLALLWLTFKAAGLRPFWAAQAVAILGAMVSNYVFNNGLTFRDQRLRGWALLRGFGPFALTCWTGVAVNICVAAALHGLEGRWSWPGLAGAVAAGGWNFWAVRRTTWKLGRTP